MTRIAEIADRLHRLAKRREDEGIYTDAALCEEAAAYLIAALAAEPGEAGAVLRYPPDRGLGEQKRAFGDTLSAESVALNHFFPDGFPLPALAHPLPLIETAPKDGSPFLAFGSYVYEGDTDPTIYMRVAKYSDEPNWPWRDAEGLHRETFYSHWMPFPTAPSPEAKGGKRP